MVKRPVTKHWKLMAISLLAGVLWMGGASALADGLGPANTGLYSSNLPKAGNRIFIEPLVAKDADIDNQFTVTPAFGSGYQGSSILSVPFTLEKRLTERFSLQAGSLDETVFAPGFHPTGLAYAELQGKYLFFESDEHEAMASLIGRLLTPSGAPNVGQGNPLTLNTYLVLSKGFGDLPIGWFRPFAFQGDIALLTPFGSGPQPLARYLGLDEFGETLRFDAALEYSLLYLNDIMGVHVPPFFNQLTPAVEARTLTNLASNGYRGVTAGYVSYELNYQASWYQISVAFQQPVGRDGPIHTYNWLLYTTFFYDDLLSRLGFNPTPW